MKNLFIIICSFLITLLNAQTKKIQLGSYSYNVKQKKYFYKEYNGLDVITNQYYLGKILSITCLESMKRNDSIYSKGISKFDNNNKFLKCKEINYYEAVLTADSIITTSRQIKNGSFKMLNYKRYKDGKVIDQYPKN